MDRSLFGRAVLIGACLLTAVGCQQQGNMFDWFKREQRTASKPPPKPSPPPASPATAEPAPENDVNRRVTDYAAGFETDDFNAKIARQENAARTPPERPAPAQTPPDGRLATTSPPTEPNRQPVQSVRREPAPVPTEPVASAAPSGHSRPAELPRQSQPPPAPPATPPSEPEPTPMTDVSSPDGRMAQASPAPMESPREQADAARQRPTDLGPPPIQPPAASARPAPTDSRQPAPASEGAARPPIIRSLSVEDGPDTITENTTPTDLPAVKPPTRPEPVLTPPASPARETPPAVANTSSTPPISPPARTQTEPDPTIADSVRSYESAIKVNPNDIESQFRLRMLYLADGRDDLALADTPGMNSELQTILRGMVRSMQTARTDVGRDPAAWANRQLEALNELQSLVKAKADLKVPVIALCRSVKEFGRYEPIDPPEFPAGKASKAILYVEVENFRHDTKPNGEFRTLMAMRTSLLTGLGREIWSAYDDDIEDATRRPRKDFFLVKMIAVPDRLQAGEYVLKVEIEDKLASKLNGASMKVRIVAPTATETAARP